MLDLDLPGTERACASEVSGLHHWRMHVRTSYVCPVVFDVSSMLRFAYNTITIKRETSAKPCLFQQCTSDISDWVYVIGSMPQDSNTLNGRKVTRFLVQLYHN